MTYLDDVTAIPRYFYPRLVVLGELMSMKILSPGIFDLLLTPLFILACLAFATPQSLQGVKVPVIVRPMCSPVALVTSSPWVPQFLVKFVDVIPFGMLCYPIT